MGRLRGGRHNTRSIVLTWVACLGVSVVYHFYPLLKKRDYVLYGKNSLDSIEEDKAPDDRFDYRPPKE